MGFEFEVLGINRENGSELRHDGGGLCLNLEGKLQRWDGEVDFYTFYTLRAQQQHHLSFRVRGH